MGKACGQFPQRHHLVILLLLLREIAHTICHIVYKYFRYVMTFAYQTMKIVAMHGGTFHPRRCPQLPSSSCVSKEGVPEDLKRFISTHLSPAIWLIKIQQRSPAIKSENRRLSLPGLKSLSASASVRIVLWSTSQLIWSIRTS